ncbi:fam-b protein [Plasmodium yoelii]|uniref:Fam-b protein n=2 Tax=Plasmodium yoelii TaxID=5861 RepID=A0AAE9WRM4_PLAYO|nr:fam-b protein [Plasmodium yoelii]XP_034493419.1 fam-b protein [Plasmodium yoelii]WBY55832.1 fam-b protein [Plasmodium yoelii yoelii]WBY55850.1 fam-b protein [Plasmodium yoelii yoelii]VTZ75036.1 fam-b protein [Plasmodium yoelii]VTZ75070.1 fam-b protein [Plasmodium yoelii]|eukprot:XP_034493407.1 fam-b protein [Plasmodium yoelii]
MRVSILKYALFSIFICSFEYGKNELCLERNIINIRNNRILSDGDNQFNLHEFYESTSSVENQVNDHDNDDEKNISIRNTVDSHVKKNKKSKKSLYSKNVDKKRKKLIHGHHKEIKEIEEIEEIEETEKEIDNTNNNKLAIVPIENNSVSEELENEGNIVVSEHYEINSSIEDELNDKLELNKMVNGLITKVVFLNMLVFALSVNEWIEIGLIIMSVALSFEIFFRFYQYLKLRFKVYKRSLKKKESPKKKTSNE